jgi:hypothetical protein
MGNQNSIDRQGANQASGSYEKQIAENEPDGFNLFIVKFLKTLYPAIGLWRYDIVICKFHVNTAPVPIRFHMIPEQHSIPGLQVVHRGNSNLCASKKNQIVKNIRSKKI